MAFGAYAMFHVAALSRSYQCLTLEIERVSLFAQIDLRTANSPQHVINSIVDRIESSLMLVPNADELQEGDIILVTPFEFGRDSIPHRWYRIESHKLVQVDPSIGAIEFKRIPQY